jgi:cytochrome b561
MAVSYTGIARALHWLTAGLLVLSFTLGFSMTTWVADEDKIRVYGWHEWVGVTVFGLTVLRLLWRLRHPPPPLPPDVGRTERLVAGLVYAAFYLMLFVQPILGWMTSTAFGFPVVYLGLVPLPNILAEDRALAERLAEIHELAAFVLLGLIVLHVAGVLFHHLIRRDAILSRMLPGVRSPM